MSHRLLLAVLCLSAGFPALIRPAAAQTPPAFQFAFGSDVLNAPRSIAVRGSEVFVLEYSGRRVSVFDENGTFLRSWGSSGTGDGQFTQPRQLTATPAGFVYVTDDYRMDVQVFDLQGTFIRKFGGAGGADSLFDHPDGITYDDAGNIWVVDRFHSLVKTFDPQGNHLATLPADARFVGLTDLVVTPQYLYTTIWSGSYTGMCQWQLDGTFVAQSTVVYTRPQGMDQAPDGNLYVAAGPPIHRTFIVDPATLDTVVDWGGYGAGDDQFASPYDVAVSASGTVYVVESESNQVKVFAYPTKVEPETWGGLKTRFD